MDLLKALAIGAMFGVGIFQMLRRNVVRSTIGLIIISNAVDLFLLSTGAYQGLVRGLRQRDRPAQQQHPRRWCSLRDRHQHGRILAGAGAALCALGALSPQFAMKSQVEELSDERSSPWRVT